MWRERAVTLALSIIRILLEKEEEFFHRYGKRGDAISLLSEVLLKEITQVKKNNVFLHLLQILKFYSQDHD